MSDRVKLYRIALITAPILAIYTMAPISLFASSGLIKPVFQPPFSDANPFRFLIPISFITVNALVLWFFNIWLVFKADQLNRRNRTFIRYVISFAFSMLFVAIHLTFTSQIRPPQLDIGTMRYYPFIGTLANNAIILILIDLVLSRSKRSRLEFEKINLEMLHQRARHDQLKQQIHPHFLFNALNTLNILIKKKGKEAEEYLMTLSNYLRHSITDEKKELVSLKEELETLEHFLKLQLSRFPRAIHCTITISERQKDVYSIPVYGIQILVENAIKHNGFTLSNPLKIYICLEKDWAVVTNNLIPKKQGFVSTGIGLKNLSERTKMLVDHDIQVVKTKEHFTVKVKMV